MKSMTPLEKEMLYRSIAKQNQAEQHLQDTIVGLAMVLGSVVLLVLFIILTR